MSDFGTMYTRIGDELHKTATTEDARIKQAIITAIEAYKYERFWFNESWMEFTTTADKDQYADGDFTLDDGSTNLPLADILRIDSLTYNRGTNWRYPLQERLFDSLEWEKTSPDTTGYPDYWARGYTGIRIWPIPSETGDKIEGKIVRDISALTTASTDSATNAWLVEAEELIRNRAMRDLCLTHYHNEGGARRYAAMEADAYSKLRLNTERLLSHGGRLEPYW